MLAACGPPRAANKARIAVGLELKSATLGKVKYTALHRDRAPPSATPLALHLAPLARGSASGPGWAQSLTERSVSSRPVGPRPSAVLYESLVPLRPLPPGPGSGWTIMHQQIDGIDERTRELLREDAS